ncbi:glycoside hydrolase family 31 protein [Reinekea sp.]|jgi:alpha-glucosidase|uniref:glycoside hydrolase family 31 protein n=1 Tax=Reinekea sp. TaxID=1970455 RepID=UPI003989C272
MSNAVNQSSSISVQPEIVLANNAPIQRRVEGYRTEISSSLGSRIDHEHFPIVTRHLNNAILRVCIGTPSTKSFAIQYDNLNTPEVQQASMEWTWRPNAHWQVGYHRHGTGFSTSRGLYTDDSGAQHLYLNFENHWPVYGLGEKTGELNKKNRRWSFWNSDVFAPHTEATDELYQSIPFFITKTDQGWLGVFLDNPGRCTLDFSLNAELCISVNNGAIDLYLISGESLPDILKHYTDLTGKPFLPPKWALGYHQSRHSYQSSEEVIQVVEQFRQHGIGLDALYLDIMYMDEYRVFSFDPKQFQKAPAMVEKLRSLGVHTVPIVDPGVKVDDQYRVYQQGLAGDYFIKGQDQNPWQGIVWPGVSVWPDFFNQEVSHWWRDLHHFYIDMGIQGFWNDMNEPAVFNEQKTIDDNALHYIDGETIEHGQVHNAYGLLMSEATAQAVTEHANQRPFVLTRAGYAGIQRSAAVWTGDNRSSWEHLRMSIPMLLNLGLSGVAFAGADIGGFMDNAQPELFVRWMQLGTFYPFMRNHCSIGLQSQEPWSFGEPWTKIATRAIQRRYAILPYLYQLFRDANETGTPIMRAMMWHDPSEVITENMADQFMLGQAMLVAPIMEPGQLARAVWLPKGQWLNVHEDKLVMGSGYQLAHAGLEDIPMFLRAGSILPLAPPRLSSEAPMTVLRLLIIEGKESNRILFRDDDGISIAKQSHKYVRLSFGYQLSQDIVECHLSIDQSQFKAQWSVLEIGLPSAWKKRKMTMNGVDLLNDAIVDGLSIKITFATPAIWL